MDSFKMITLSAGFISIILTIFESIYPAEKFKKQMKLIFALIFILCIVTPFVKGDINLTEIDDYVSASSYSISSSEEKTMEYFRQSVENNVSRAIGEYLNENKISFSEIKTSINISDSGSIFINEIEIAVDSAAQEDEIVALVKNKTDEDTPVKIKENTAYEQTGND